MIYTIQLSPSKWNGKRNNKNLIERVHNLAINVHILAQLWVETISTTNYLINMSSTNTNDGFTPYQQFFSILLMSNTLKCLDLFVSCILMPTRINSC